MSSPTSRASASGDLTDLASSSGASTGVSVHPSDDAVLTVLQQRFRMDEPYARIGASHFVAINPYKALSNTNDASAYKYAERCYRDTSIPMAGSPALPPHPFELAAQMYLLLRRRNESQAVIFRFVSSSTDATHP
jgi:chitin synthase